MLGQRLKEFRVKSGLSQSEIAEQLKVSRSLLSNYENEINKPSIDVIISLAEIYGVSTDYLLGRDTCDKIKEELEAIYKHADNIMAILRGKNKGD